MRDKLEYVNLTEEAEAGWVVEPVGKTEVLDKRHLVGYGSLAKTMGCHGGCFIFRHLVYFHCQLWKQGGGGGGSSIVASTG